MKYHSRALATFQIWYRIHTYIYIYIYIYISHSPFTLHWLCLHSCTIACALKQTFAQCEISLEGTLAAITTHKQEAEWQASDRFEQDILYTHAMNCDIIHSNSTGYIYSYNTWFKSRHTNLLMKYVATFQQRFHKLLFYFRNNKHVCQNAMAKISKSS